MDARRGRDAERGRLQRAAYRRDATDADREALAAFERREAVPVERRVSEPPVAPMVVVGREGEPRADAPSSAGNGRSRRAALVLAAVALTSAAAGATAAALVISAATPPPAIASLVEPPPGAQRESASGALSLFLEGLEISGTLPIAGPALLTTTERFDIYGFAHGDAEAQGGQTVCLGAIGLGGYSSSSGSTCVDRSVFERDGLRVSIDAPGSGALGAEAIWRPDGSVEITDGP